MRTSFGGDLGPELANCQNVSTSSRTDTFITDFYLTTWWSALAEGASIGASEGAEGKGGAGVVVAALLASPREESGALLVPASNTPQPFCRVIEAKHETVGKALRAAMLDLAVYGYRLENRGKGGLHQTNFMKNEHQAAAWFDRFTAYSAPVGQDLSAVYVMREVFISRDGKRYDQGYSVGNNEDWILTKIAESVK